MLKEIHFQVSFLKRFLLVFMYAICILALVYVHI